MGSVWRSRLRAVPVAGVGCRSPGRFSFEERDARLMHTFAKAISIAPMLAKLLRQAIAPMLAKLVRLAIAPMLAKFVHLAPVLENLRELTAHYVQILSVWDNRCRLNLRSRRPSCPISIKRV